MKRNRVRLRFYSVFYACHTEYNSTYVMPNRYFHVPLPDNTYSLKSEQKNGKQHRLQQTSSPIHIVFQRPMPKSRKLPATQYDTIQYSGKHPTVRYQSPLLSGSGKECPHFRTNKKIRVAWGFKNLYDDMPARIARAVHLNLEAIFSHSPYYRYRNQKLGLTPKQQECIRQVCRKHGWKEEVVFDRYTEEYDW